MSRHTMVAAAEQALISTGFFVVAYVYWRKREWIKDFTIKAMGDSPLVDSTAKLNVRVMPVAIALFGVLWLVIAVSTIATG